MIFVCSLPSFGLGFVGSVLLAAYVSKAVFRTTFLLLGILVFGALTEGLTGFGGGSPILAVTGVPAVLASVVSLWLGCVATYSIADLHETDGWRAGSGVAEEVPEAGTGRGRLEDGT